MSEQLGIAVIGSGYWGGNYVRLFTELPDTRVVAVCDQLTENLKRIDARFPGLKLTTNTDDLLQMDDIDAVVISTNATSHYAIAQRFIRARKPVLLEKPMTISVRDAEALVELAEDSGTVLMVGHIYLYNTAIREVKTYIECGAIGRLYYLYAQRTNLGPIRDDVNALWDLAPHDIAVFNYLVGASPVWVSAVGHRVLDSCEDVGFIVLGYANNIIGQIHVSWVDPDKVRQIVVVGSEMRILFNDLNPQEPVRIFEKGVQVRPDIPAAYDQDRFSIRNGNIVSPNIKLTEPLRAQGMHFVDCVRNGTRPLSDGRNGLEVVRVMEAIDHSIRQRGAPARLTGEMAYG